MVRWLNCAIFTLSASSHLGSIPSLACQLKMLNTNISKAQRLSRSTNLKLRIKSIYTSTSVHYISSVKLPLNTHHDIAASKTTSFLQSLNRQSLLLRRTRLFRSVHRFPCFLQRLQTPINSPRIRPIPFSLRTRLIRRARNIFRFQTLANSPWNRAIPISRASRGASDCSDGWCPLLRTLWMASDCGYAERSSRIDGA